MLRGASSSWKTRGAALTAQPSTAGCGECFLTTESLRGTEKDEWRRRSALLAFDSLGTKEKMARKEEKLRAAITDVAQSATHATFVARDDASAEGAESLAQRDAAYHRVGMTRECPAGHCDPVVPPHTQTSAQQVRCGHCRCCDSSKVVIISRVWIKVVRVE